MPLPISGKKAPVAEAKPIPSKISKPSLNRKLDDAKVGAALVAGAIVVNARRHEVTRGKLSFEALLALAFNPIPTGPNVSFTVLYRKGPHERPEGSVVAGQTVHVREGEVFNVRHTDKF